jgi:hypothetical protein
MRTTPETSSAYGTASSSLGALRSLSWTILLRPVHALATVVVAAILVMVPSWRWAPRLQCSALRSANICQQLAPATSEPSQCVDDDSEWGISPT